VSSRRIAVDSLVSDLSFSPRKKLHSSGSWQVSLHHRFKSGVGSVQRARRSTAVNARYASDVFSLTETTSAMSIQSDRR